MTKGRKTIFEERVEIVQYCIAHEHNYTETAKKYQVSYQRACSYTVKYETGGVKASFLKTRRDREETGLSLIHHEYIYQAIKDKYEKYHYAIKALCKLRKVSRTAYDKWLHREVPEKEQNNRQIADKIEKIHAESPDKGYRWIRDDLDCYHGIQVNDKRVLRICRRLNMKSTIKYANHGCTRQAANP